MRASKLKLTHYVRWLRCCSSNQSIASVTQWGKKYSALFFSRYNAADKLIAAHKRRLFSHHPNSARGDEVWSVELWISRKPTLRLQEIPGTSEFFLNQCSRAEFVLLQTAWERKKQKLNTHYRVLINMVFNKSPQYLKSNENCNMNATKNVPRVLKGYIYWFCGTLIFPLNTFIFYHLIVLHVFIRMCKMLWIESLSRTQRHEISVTSAPT